MHYTYAERDLKDIILLNNNQKKVKLSSLVGEKEDKIFYSALLLFIGLVFICMKQGLYHKQYGLCGGLISFLCFAFSSYPFQYPSFWTVLCFLLAGMATIQSKPQIYSDNLSLPILFVSSVCVFLSLSSPYKQIEIWGKCRILYPKGETALAINGYKLLYPSLKHSPKFIFEYAQYLSGNKEYEISNALYERYLKLQCNSLIYNFIGDNYLKLSQFQLAEKYYKKSINFLPNRINQPYYSSEKRTSTSRYELNIFDFETKPRYLPSWSTTGRFQAWVSSKVRITCSMLSVS